MLVEKERGRRCRSRLEAGRRCGEAIRRSVVLELVVGGDRVGVGGRLCCRLCLAECIRLYATGRSLSADGNRRTRERRLLPFLRQRGETQDLRSEEHTSELQSQ